MKRLLLGLLMILAMPVGLVRAQTATSESFLFEMGELLEAGAGSGVGVPSFGASSSAEASNSADYGDFLVSTFGLYDGFPDAASASSALQVAVDNLSIDFGGMTPGVLVQRQSQLLINSNVPIGYSVYAQQDTPMQLARYFGTSEQPSEREMISNTTCDDGGCTYETAGVWNNQDIPGFGYTVMAADGLAEFNNGGAYKGFPSRSQNQDAALIAQDLDTSQVIANRNVVVQYQVGVKPSNVAGLYNNAISYTLVPNF